MWSSVYLRYILSEEPLVTARHREEVTNPASTSSFPCTSARDEQVGAGDRRRYGYLETNLDEDLTGQDESIIGQEEFLHKDESTGRDESTELAQRQVQNDELSVSETALEVEEEDEADDSGEEVEEITRFAVSQPVSKTGSSTELEEGGRPLSQLHRSNTLPSQLVSSLLKMVPNILPGKQSP